MAGDIAKTWTSKSDRDKWLEEQGRWVPSADHPAIKEAFAAHEHLREERRAIEARGDSWQRVEEERRLKELDKMEEELKSEGGAIRRLSAEEFCAESKLAQGPARKVEGNAFEQQFSSRASLLPDMGSLAPALPEWRDPFEGNDASFEPSDLEKEFA
jgi:hypothetical protein